MKIIYFSQFYQPESIAAAFRASEHSRYWAGDGHDVTVFTGWPSYPAGRLFDGYRMERLGEEAVDGVRVFRSRHSIRPNTSFAKRVAGGLSFILNGIRNLGAGSPVGADYDVALVTSGTVFAAWLGKWYARRAGLPLVVEVRDITYKQMEATGSAAGDPKVRLMRAFELSIYRSADRLVVLTDGFRDELVARGFDPAAISVVPNGADLVDCPHDFSGPLSLGYFGTMGISQDVPRTLRYAAALAADGLLDRYVIVGEGASRGAVEEAARSGAGFVELMRGMPKDELEAQYARVGMTVVSLQDSPAFEGTIPSKVFQSFARGVPVLFIGPEGEAARLVRESGGGLALCGSDAENLEALRRFAGSPGLAGSLGRMGASARGYVAANCTRRIMASRMLGALKDCVDSTQGRQGEK